MQLCLESRPVGDVLVIQCTDGSRPGMKSLCCTGALETPRSLGPDFLLPVAARGRPFELSS